jgi:hypothetical protein
MSDKDEELKESWDDQMGKKRILRADGIDKKNIPTEVLESVMKKKYCFEIRIKGQEKTKFAYTDEPDVVEEYLRSIGATIVKVDVNEER